MQKRGGGGLIRTIAQINAALDRIDQGGAKPKDVAMAAELSRAQWFNLKAQLATLGVKIEFVNGAYVLKDRGQFKKG